MVGCSTHWAYRASRCALDAGSNMPTRYKCSVTVRNKADFARLLSVKLLFTLFFIHNVAFLASILFFYPKLIKGLKLSFL